MPVLAVRWLRVVAPPYSCVHSLTAFAATAKAIVGAITNGVFFGKFVTMIAMRLTSVFSGWPNASKIVNSGRHAFDVNGIYARSISAKVIRLIIGRHDMHEHLKCGSLGRLGLPFIGKFCVAIYRNVTSPHPAGDVVVKQYRAYGHLAEKAKEDAGINGKSARITLNHSSLLNRFDGLRFRGLTHREASLILA